MFFAQALGDFPGAVRGCVVRDGHPPRALQIGVEESGQPGDADGEVSLFVVDGNGYVNGLGHAVQTTGRRRPGHGCGGLPEFDSEALLSRCQCRKCLTPVNTIARLC